jgi:DNA repair exonuclease SbcCD nuclease subunit
MHYSLVGNHDASTSNLLFNSINSFLGDRHQIVTEPSVLPLDDCFICFLPYMVEYDRKPLGDYFANLKQEKRPIVILSHNDISGIQLGPIVSKTGFSIEEINSACDLFINGHLHNGQAITDKIINLGNLTGKDFGEDAMKYKHSVAILDTETLTLEFIENPYAYNFYKVQISSKDDLKILSSFKNQAVVSIKCESTLIDVVKQQIQNCKNIVESRIILMKCWEETSDSSTETDLFIDHLARFVDCCKSCIDNTYLLEEELNEICK